MHGRDEKQFAAECLGWFSPPSDEELYFRRLAMEYHQLTEEADRCYCSGRRGLLAVPTNGYEYAAVQRNSRQILNYLMQRELHYRNPEFESSLRLAISRSARDFERSLREGTGEQINTNGSLVGKVPATGSSIRRRRGFVADDTI